MNTCNYCSNQFTPKSGSTGKFCSKSCAAKLNNTIYPKRKRDIVLCLNCETQLTYRQKKYCSTLCSSAHKSKVRIEAWLTGENTGSGKGGEISASVRAYLIRLSEDKCSKCGWAEINKATGRVPLTVDHIDGNWKNNDFDNLRILCPNCHSLTETFGSLNKGKFSNSRSVGSRRH